MLKFVSIALFIVATLVLFLNTEFNLLNWQSWVITLGGCLSGFISGLDLNLTGTIKEVIKNEYKK